MSSSHFALLFPNCILQSFLTACQQSLLFLKSVLYIICFANLGGQAFAAYDSSCSTNVATYWGQNSWGATRPTENSTWEKPLASYCGDDTFDIINLSFLVDFNLTGLPVLNHAFHCEKTMFEGTNTLNCPDIGTDIKTCQGRGKKIVLSLGGGGITTYALSSEADGAKFADTVWNMFLGGSHDIRPYGDAILDGVDLDIESGAHDGYVAFINQLRTYFKDESKQYIISAAPQCVFPDTNLGSTLSGSAWIDNDYVQFYNNPCGLASIDDKWNFNYASWDNLTKANTNPSSKMYVGLPAGSGAAGSGYVDLSAAQKYLKQLYSQYSSTFGGIMLWDASWYTNNQEYVKGLSSWVKSNMKCGSASNQQGKDNSNVIPSLASASDDTTPISYLSTLSEVFPNTDTQPDPDQNVGIDYALSASTTVISSANPFPTSDQNAEPTSMPLAQLTASSASLVASDPVALPAASDCTSSGNQSCASSGISAAYSVCVNGALISGTCGTGTVCIQSGSAIYCGWPS